MTGLVRGHSANGKSHRRFGCSSSKNGLLKCFVINVVQIEHCCRERERESPKIELHHSNWQGCGHLADASCGALDFSCAKSGLGRGWRLEWDRSGPGAMPAAGNYPGTRTRAKPTLFVFGFSLLPQTTPDIAYNCSARSTF